MGHGLASPITVQKGGNVTIYFCYDGPDAQDELASLYGRLIREDDVRQHANVSLQGAAPREGEQGAGPAEILQLILDDGFQAASLAIAYAAWRGARPRHPGRMTLRCGDVAVTLEGTDAETAAAIASIVQKDIDNG